ncbi:MAG TPA: hypothetical protein VFI31_26730, partial [Pirellulales bacterium]|nr:hypothetical protein [Pirellulales bacterium]
MQARAESLMRQARLSTTPGPLTAILLAALTLATSARRADGGSTNDSSSPAALGYRFNEGENYGFSFALRAERSEGVDHSTGFCMLTLNRGPTPPEFASQEKTHEGNGSGFVVTSD